MSVGAPVLAEGHALAPEVGPPEPQGVLHLPRLHAGLGPPGRAPRVPQGRGGLPLPAVRQGVPPLRLVQHPRPQDVLRRGGGRVGLRGEGGRDRQRVFCGLGTGDKSCIA